ncbi:MAG TPA: NapC/NirT family cytochrome c [Thermoanaerobaculia bacterium]|nr:NapC/NirT family cytochrome c [Thermoanaerobaculia bacterium]
MSLARNPWSGAGLLIASIALANILFLVAADLFTERHNPYLGIFAYLVVPAFLVFGLFLFFLGILLERRRRHRHAPDVIARYPRLDFNHPRTRTIFGIGVVAAFVFLVATLLGSYQAYHYTDSDQFCGTTCHSVMHPEYTAYQQSPHARVGCVQCHIGSGATWYVKSKLSGAYQVYAMVAKKYPKPIPTPVANLRPAQETCEQCHWPAKFWGAQMKVFNHFGYDEANTPRETRMLILTGGGSPTLGRAAGIHWHMNIGNEVTYIATDAQRQKIPWVRMRDRRTGRVTEYAAKDVPLTQVQLSTLPRRVMDCVDCHNRPTHIYVPPDRSVDEQLVAGTIDRTLPYIKQKSVEVLTASYATTDEALAAIAKNLDAYYRTDHAEVYASKKAALARSIAAVQTTYRATVFPEMKVDWRTHPDNRGHFYYSGCFRCHDNQHVSKDGKVISKACDLCHNVLSQKEGTTLMVQAPDAGFVHPVDLGDLSEVTCSECHTGSGM